MYRTASFLQNMGMIILLSPAKTMDFTPEALPYTPTEPLFLSQAEHIMAALKNLTNNDISQLLNIQGAIAENTIAAVRSFGSPDTPFKRAVFAYRGAVFQQFTDALKQTSALEQIYILSALYGLLRATDLISPYRLDMKVPTFLVEQEKPISLLQYWREKVTDEVASLMKSGDKVVNLASKEFSEVIDRKRLPNPLLTIDFKEMRGDSVRTIGTYAKQARGKMVGKILMEGFSSPEDLKREAISGYHWSEKLSKTDNWVFIHGK